MEPVPCPSCSTFFTIETNSSNFVQSQNASEPEKPYGKRKSLQQIRIIKMDNVCRERNVFRTILTTGKIIVVGILKRLLGTVLFKKYGT